MQGGRTSRSEHPSYVAGLSPFQTKNPFERQCVSTMKTIFAVRWATRNSSVAVALGSTVEGKWRSLALSELSASLESSLELPPRGWSTSMIYSQGGQ